MASYVSPNRYLLLHISESFGGFMSTTVIDESDDFHSGMRFTHSLCLINGKSTVAGIAQEDNTHSETLEQGEEMLFRNLCNLSIKQEALRF